MDIWECKLAGLLWHVEMQSVCIVIRESLLISPLGGRDKRLEKDDGEGG